MPTQRFPHTTTHRGARQVLSLSGPNLLPVSQARIDSVRLASYNALLRELPTLKISQISIRVITSNGRRRGENDQADLEQTLTSPSTDPNDDSFTKAQELTRQAAVVCACVRVHKMAHLTYPSGDFAWTKQQNTHVTQLKKPSSQEAAHAQT